jgi:pimeloyl-ACP methyl ester carboxylesterase
MRWFAGMVAMFLATAVAGLGQTPADVSPHKVQLIEVEKGVSVEVLDWGGRGRPLVFLAGLGRTAHDFDSFALKFTARHHVFGITRRGFGNSSKPEATEANYSADRLADDVLAVIAALKLDKPFLAGHSMAGEELSSIDNRHPEKVSGLIYLDAAGGHAFYDPAHSSVVVELNDLRRRLDRWDYMASAEEDRQQTTGLLNSNDLALLQKLLQDHLKDLDVLPPTQHGVSRAARPPELAFPNAVLLGERKFTSLSGNILAIFAVPHDFACKPTPDVKAQAEADTASQTAQAEAFEAGVPSARVVRLRCASHFVWQTHEAEVAREMNTFMDRSK